MKNGVLKTVTGTFKKISFPGKKEAHSGSCIAQMNIPYWLARRDAAYEIAIHLLKNSLVSKPHEERKKTYTKILYMLEMATTIHNRLQANHKTSSSKRIADNYKLISELVKAAVSMLNTNIILSSDKDNSQNFATTASKEIKSFQALSITTMEEEKNCYDTTMDIVLSFQPYIKKEQERSIKSLSKINKDRYSQAFNKLKELYIAEND